MDLEEEEVDGAGVEEEVGVVFGAEATSGVAEEEVVLGGGVGEEEDTKQTFFLLFLPLKSRYLNWG